MATSGSYDYSLNRNEIIQEALELIGVLDPTETLSSEDAVSCSKSLNLMVKAWTKQDIGLWAKKELALFPSQYGYQYNIGPSSSHHCTASWVKTELASAAAAAATSIVVDSITGFYNSYDRDGIMTAATPGGASSLTLNGALVTNGIAYLTDQRKILIYSDANDSGITFSVTGTDATGAAVTETITGPNTTSVYSTKTYASVSAISVSGAGTGSIEIGQVGEHIGVERTSGVLQWTHAGAAVTTTTITLVTALTTAAAVDNHVYTYNIKAQRPTEILEARLINDDDTDTPLSILSRENYLNINDKRGSDVAGDPVQIYYDKQITNGILNVWPPSNDVKKYIKLTGKYMFDDLDSSTDDFDFPQEWLETLAWNLACRIAPKYGKKLDPVFIAEAKNMFKESKDFDIEMAPVFFGRKF